jgi:hypothetical protein
LYFSKARSCTKSWEHITSLVFFTEISTVGRGKELRLFRVDRWDSGQYFCSTNTTRKSKHSVTLRVDTKPSVSAPGKQLDKKDGELKATNFAYTNLDVTAVLRCRVNTDKSLGTWQYLPASSRVDFIKVGSMA